MLLNRGAAAGDAPCEWCAGPVARGATATAAQRHACARDSASPASRLSPTFSGLGVSCVSRQLLARPPRRGRAPPLWRAARVSDSEDCLVSRALTLRDRCLSSALVSQSNRSCRASHGSQDSTVRIIRTGAARGTYARGATLLIAAPVALACSFAAAPRTSHLPTAVPSTSRVLQAGTVSTNC